MNVELYDLAFAGKIASEVEGRYEATVEGIPSPVPLVFGLPDGWHKQYSLPAINVSRIGVVPDPSRNMPAFRGQEVSQNQGTPNTINIQLHRPQPVNLLYTVTLATSSQLQMNALVVHLYRYLPWNGFGTYVEVDGRTYNYRSMSFRDRTSRESKEGKVLIHEYTYVLEAWIADLECLKVGQILTVDSTITVPLDA